MNIILIMHQMLITIKRKRDLGRLKQEKKPQTKDAL